MVNFSREARNALAYGCIALSSFTFGSGCTKNPTTTPPENSPAVPTYRLTESKRADTIRERLKQVEDVGNGVYVFPADAYFAETLSDFLAQNRGIRVASITQGPDVDYYQGAQMALSRSNSYIVVFESK